MTCPSCGRRNPDASNYCGACGVRFAGANAAPVFSPSPERRQLTVVFADLAGSTALAARLDPEDMVELIRAYQHAVSESVNHYEGFVAKYLGDGVLAYFGYPRAHEDDAIRALHASLEIVDSVKRLDATLGVAKGAPLHVRIGIATGLVVAGEMMQTSLSEEAAIVGSPPNLAARLQGLAELDAVVIGASTRVVAGDGFEYEDLGVHDLKGFDEPIRAYAVRGAIADKPRADLRTARNVATFVGREDELTTMLARWEEALAGRSQVVLVTGDAGIGKSRIVRAFEERLYGTDFRRVHLDCSPYRTNTAYSPHLTALERSAGITRDDSPETRWEKLERMLAVDGPVDREQLTLLGSLFALPLGDREPLPMMSPGLQRQRTLGALLDALTSPSREQPLLIVYEDAHWIDPSSRELLDRLVEEIGDRTVLTIVTARPSFVPEWHDRESVTNLELGRLDDVETRAMIRNIFGDTTMPSASIEHIVRKTDGVPLYVEELTRMLIDSGASKNRSGTVAIPATLSDLLMERLDRLEDAKAIAQVGAVIGREFSADLVALVASASPAEQNAQLERLVGSGLVTRRADTPVYVFKHALIQDAAYDSILFSARRQLHSTVADALQANFAQVVEEQPETLARHLTGANRHLEAASYWLRAGQQAVQRGAPAEAVAHFSTGLAGLAQLPQTPDRLGAELMLTAALGPNLMVMNGPGHPDFGAVMRRALELCRLVEAEEAMFAVTYGNCLYHWGRAEFDEAAVLAADLCERADRSGDPEFRMASDTLTSVVRFHRGDAGEAHSRLTRSTGLHRPDVHAALYPTYLMDFGVFGRFYRALALTVLGEAELGRATAAEALALAGELRQPHSYGFGLLANFINAMWRRDVPTAERFAKECVGYSAEHGFPEFVAFARITLGWASLETGNPEMAEREIGEGSSLWAATGFETWQSLFGSMHADALLALGRVDEAKGTIDAQFARIERNGEYQFRSLLLASEARAFARVGDRARAEERFRAALADARERKLPLWELRVALAFVRDATARTPSGKVVDDARSALAAARSKFDPREPLADLREATDLLGAGHAVF